MKNLRPSRTLNIFAVVAMVWLLSVNLSLAKVAGKAGKGPKDFRLLIVHSSDNESSFQDPNTLEPKILNYSTIVKGLQILARQENRALIHMTAGDHTIPGPFYQASAEVPYLGHPGLGDIEIYNAMDLKGNGMGNHEFDGGINEFAFMLNAAKYPFIAANLDFSNVQLELGTPEIQIGKDRHRAKQNAGKVVRSVWLKVGSERIGLIGRAPADFFNVIEDPDTNLPGLDFFGGRDENNQPLVSAVDQVLEEVEYLERRGINKIILIDHAQDFTADPLSANLLRGIDIIVAAGSTGFMAKEQADGPFNLLRPEDESSADYPTVRQDSEGKDVLVINSDQQYRYVGNLMVAFDKRGNVVEVDGRSGPIATTEKAIAEFENLLNMSLGPHEDVANIFADLQATPLIQDAFEEIGTTTSPLNGQRADVRSRETNLGRLAADSTLWYARQEFPSENVDIALKNGGGIRDSILGPSIIRLTIQAALAFDNQLSVLKLTADQLIAAMENAVSRAPSRDGRFPQIAGMTLEYDASKPGEEGLDSLDTPSRIKTLTITRFDGSTDVLVENYAAQGDLTRTFVLATNSFLTTGGDGYVAFAAAEELALTAIGEQEILERYILDALSGVVNLIDPPADPRVKLVAP